MIGNRVKLLRDELGLKQDELAEKIGVSPSAVGMYERDLREANDEIKLKMCKLFDCSMDYLTGNSDIRKIEKCKLDINGLGNEELKEVQRQIDFIKKIKKENER